MCNLELQLNKQQPQELKFRSPEANDLPDSITDAVFP